MSGDAIRKDGVLPVELAAAPPREHDFALVIGVEHYPSFSSLRGPVADARAFHDWVCSPDGGAVPPADTRLIVSTEQPVAPIQDQIDEALVALMVAADDVGGGRRLYFYFSGHGATDDAQLANPDNVLLLLAKWSRHLRAALSSSKYWGKLASTQLFEEIAVFLDCCRSTVQGGVGLPPMVSLEDRKSAPCPTRTFIAYAAEPARPAFELPVAGVWHGVFTRSLLAILRDSPDGIAAGALKERLELEVPNSHANQRAVVHNGFGAASWFGRRSPDPAAPGRVRGTLHELHITFRRARDTVTLLDAQLQPIARHAVTGDPWVIPLAAGLYLLSDGSQEQPIKHLAGKMTDVEF